MVKERPPVLQSAGNPKDHQDNILRVLVVPILVGLMVLSFAIVDGQYAFPEYIWYLTLQQNEPFLPSAEYYDGIVPKRLSSPGLPCFTAFFWHQQKMVPVSAWHDIPLKNQNSNLFHYVIEITKGSHAKLEIQTQEFLNPIVQDKHENGTIRYVYDFYPFHYGAFPQTWENPFVPDRWTGLVGDKDPLDVVDIGNGIYFPGDVVTVKILGVLALLGTGDETDWKIIAIDVKDPLAYKYTDISDLPLEKEIQIKEFFKFYKVPEGKIPSVFGFNEKYLNKTFATEIIEDKHQEWKKLMSGATELQFKGKTFQTGCVLCPEPTTKKEFKISEEAARRWADKEIEQFLGR